MLTEASMSTDVLNRRLDEHAEPKLLELFETYRSVVAAEHTAWDTLPYFTKDDEAVYDSLKYEAHRLTRQRVHAEHDLRERLARVDRLHGGKR